MSHQFGRRDFLRAAAVTGAAASLALAAAPPPPVRNLVEMLRLMRKIRHFEEVLTGLYKYESFLSQGDIVGDMYDFASKGIIAGAVHLYIGQEAVAVGVSAALNPDDFVTSSHRGHGHAIAKGAALGPMMAELMGRKTGCSKGCGGSMHIFSKELGLLGGNGIVGAQIPLAIGAAFSAKYRGSDQVAVAYFGEGASNQGTFHEALHMAALWELPVVFVCENNLYAASTAAEITLAIPNVAERGAGYGMPGHIVDGQDVLAVYAAASAAVERARAGGGPTLLECKTYRFTSHAGAGRGQHNNPEELKVWLNRDPIALFEKKLRDDGVMTAAEQEGLKQQVLAEVEEAVAFAKNSPFPTFDEMPVTPDTDLLA
ncbi:MAG: thiamine pyrophosphate-dependent enzyme [Thermoguttaceae bacterium]|jgi:pyruvate dehydrogenase E1 component alpha subunit|nr:thiamine pyrophosphate-dependent enzyme [Thermoguttaceae bacterium]